METGTRNALLPLTLLASASGARTWAGVGALEPRSVVPVFHAGELAREPRMWDVSSTVRQLRRRCL